MRRLKPFEDTDTQSDIEVDALPLNPHYEQFQV